VGKGIRTAQDTLFTLTPARAKDVYVLVTRGGYVSARQAGRLTITLQETIKFEMQDYLVGAFTIQPEQWLVIAAQNGEVYTQKNPWAEPQSADGSKRRLLLAGARAGGISVVGAGAGAAGSWHFRLTKSGRILIGRVDGPAEKRPARNTAQPAEAPDILAFTLWQPSKPAESGSGA